MDQPNLPRHVVERVERRWAAVLSHQTMTRPQRERVGMTDPAHDVTKQTPKKGTAQPTSRRPAWNGLF
jgi:hypothetical protein